MQTKDQLIGKCIGNYRIVAELSKNLSTRVYLAQHIFLPKRRVAIKFLPAALHSTPEQEQRFLQEAQLLDLLQHPYFLPVIDVGLDEHIPYIMTAYAPNGSLRDRLNHHLNSPLPLKEALRILTQIGQAISFAHQHNIIHCDLKPENILFNSQNDAMLADFGVAAVVSDAHNRPVEVSGSLSYAAPEQFEGIISKESDQYALGCIAYELFTGHEPFTALSIRSLKRMHKQAQPIPPRQFTAQLPAHIEQAILKALAKQPDERHPDVAAFLTALGVASLSQQPSSALPTASSSTSDLHIADFIKEHWLDEALALQQLKRYPEALHAYEQAQACDPDDSYVYIGQGLVLCDLQRYEEALPLFERAIALDASDTYSYINAGFALKQLSRYEDALAMYEQAISLDPNDAEAYLGKGSVLERMQRDQDALQALEEAIMCNADSVIAWQQKTGILQRLGLVEQTQHAQSKAQQLIAIAEARNGA